MSKLRNRIIITEWCALLWKYEETNFKCECGTHKRKHIPTYPQAYGINRNDKKYA